MSDWEYDDIIDMPHHVSATRKPMSMEARAAQFAPFAALSGHDEAINETARLTTGRIELSPDEQRMLALRLRLALERSTEGHPATFTVFEPDTLKEGGRYIRVSGVIRRVETATRTIFLSDGASLCMDDIIAISGL